MRLGKHHPTYIIAELSANHNQDFESALKTIEAAKAAGADAIKLQTYTADTMTLKGVSSDNEIHFQISGGTPWDGKTLHALYQEAHTPWEWHGKMMERARELDLDCFSSAFDCSAVDFLETLGVPAHKVASFELLDHELIEKMARTGKPLIMSTGMATLQEIEEAVSVARKAGAKELILLKCTSAYPAPFEEANLATIADLETRFGVPVGLSDHTLGTTVPVVAVALGACVIEKHFTLSRKVPGPDSSFSLEPAEFAEMVKAVRIAEKAVGKVLYGTTENQKSSLAFRRTLWVVKPVKAGELFSRENVRAIRPGQGLPPKHLPQILGHRASQDLDPGTPLSWNLID